MALGDILSGVEEAVETGVSLAERVAPLVVALRGEPRQRGGGGSGVPTPVQPVMANGGMLQQASMAPALQSLLRGLQAGGLMAGGAELAEPGILTRLITGGEGGDDFYRTTAAGNVVASRRIERQNPRTGKINTWINQGESVLFKGDLDACSRVKRVARKTASASGLRFRKATRRRR